MAFESGTGKSRLANYAVERSAGQFGVKRNRDGGGSGRVLPLHNDMAASLPHSLESMLLLDPARGFTRERAEFRQPEPRPV